MAAERYLLGELTDAERDQFEEHFFDCSACADDVRGTPLPAGARELRQVVTLPLERGNRFFRSLQVHVEAE